MNLEALRKSEKPVVQMKEAAAILGVDQRTVSGAVRDGQLPAIRVGKRVLIPKDKFLEPFETGSK